MPEDSDMVAALMAKHALCTRGRRVLCPSTRSCTSRQADLAAAVPASVEGPPPKALSAARGLIRACEHARASVRRGPR